MVKILVVDDHDMVRMGLMRMLADVEGFEVIGEAKSGEEALSMARGSNLDGCKNAGHWRLRSHAPHYYQRPLH
jgi:CheY-like chemotaxis protein